MSSIGSGTSFFQWVRAQLLIWLTQPQISTEGSFNASVDPYCPRCGAQVTPPNASIFAAKDCAAISCSKKIYRTPSMSGLSIEKGDTVGFTPGAIRISFDPTSGIQFSEAGASALLHQHIFEGSAGTTKSIRQTLKFYEEATDRFLSDSLMLKNLDIHDQDDSEAVWSRVSRDTASREFAALCCGQFCQTAKSKLDAGEAEAAMVDTNIATLFFVAFIVRESNFSRIVWRGHEAHFFLHQVKAASSRTLAEAQAIETLRPTISALSTFVIRAWLEDNAPIAPRLGIANLGEKLARATLVAELQERTERSLDLGKNKEARRFWIEFITKHLLGFVIGCLTVAVSSFVAYMTYVKNK